MNPISKAVFLSYASQDADAVGRICAALREAGIEVWFDKNELRGGDAWDRKIRGQIRDCALFVPVISANTQARPEGYFRLEWKLAVDRSHQIADDQPFLLPVVIDGTTDAAARVPDRFRDVQWTRLRLEESPAQFGARVQALLAGTVAGHSGADPAQAPGPSGRARPGSRSPVVGVAFGGLALVAAGVAAFVFLGPKPSPPPATPAPAAAPVSAPKNSEARDLALRARKWVEAWDESTREDFALAEELLKTAVQKDPTDAEAWATYGMLSCAEYMLGFDHSPERVELARSASERAIKLDEKSFQARFTRAAYLRLPGGSAVEAERLLRVLTEEQPKNVFVLRTLASLLRGRATRGDEAALKEALTLLDRGIAAGDPLAHYHKYILLWYTRRFVAAEQAVDRGLAASPSSILYRAKATIAATFHGKVDEAAAMVAKVSPGYLREDVGAYWAATVYLWGRDGARAFAVLQNYNRELIECVDYTGPKAFLAGEAQRIAGHPEAAALEYTSALKTTERLLAGAPNSIPWNRWKVRLFAQLGRKTETEEALKVYLQLFPNQDDAAILELVPVYVLLGRADEFITQLEKNNTGIFTPAGRESGLFDFLHYRLQFSPEFDTLRDYPAFQSLLARTPENSPAASK